MGLPICQRIMEQLHGNIRLEPSSEGTVFILEFLKQFFDNFYKIIIRNRISGISEDLSLLTAAHNLKEIISQVPKCCLHAIL